MEQDNKEKILNLMINKYPALWAMKHKTIKGKPLTFVSSHNPFANRPWQQELLNDTHPNKVIQKSRQLGLSEMAVTEALWFADTHDNVNIMYTFPTKQQMEDFSKTRIDPVLMASPHLQRKLNKKLNNVSTKAIGTSNLFMRTSGDGSQGEGADIDMYCADEYDRMKDGVELAFAESLTSSKYGLMRRWSTPTVPGRGINALFLKSDQKTYLHKCEHCNTWQEITMNSIFQIKKDGVNKITGEIKKGTFEFLCKKCKRPLNRWKPGEWVAKNKDVKDLRGYFISQLNATHISADKIKEREYQYISKQLFNNYVVGMPYANTSLLISEEDVKNMITLENEEFSRRDDYIGYVAGIDWGEPSWVVVLGLTRNHRIQVVSLKAFFRSETQPLYDVKCMISHLKPFNPNLIIADAGYGADKNTELLRAFPYVTYTCTWKTVTNPHSPIHFTDRWNESTRMVTVDKTSKMQRTLQSVKRGFIGFYTWNDEMTQTIAKHLQNVRILDNEKDGIVYQSATRVGPDHLACCLSYGLIGIDRLTQYGINVSQGYKMEFINP